MSRDNELGIARQVQDCRAEIVRRGWDLAGEFIDDGVSATSSRRRPEYERLLMCVRGGAAGAVVVWDQDRLTRQPRQVEDWIDLAEQRGVQVVSAHGVDLLADPFSFGVKGLVSRQEVVQLKKRLRRSLVQRAESGKAHGRPAYGWRAELVQAGARRVRTGPDELDPEAAGVVQETARRLLAGESMRSITSDMNRRGFVTAGGGRWSAQQLRTIMLRPRNAGIRVHRGEEISVGDWPPIYDRGMHDRVVALLTDPARHRNVGAAPRHLLSKLARCGRCNTPTMVVNPGHKRRPAYVCGECHRVTRVQAPVDDLVAEVVIRRLMLPDATAALAPPDRADQLEAARTEVAAIRARLDRAADAYAGGAIDMVQLKRITAGLQPALDAAEARVAASLPRADLAPMAGPDARERWTDAPLDVRRAVIDTLMTVTILPEAPKGRAPFNPDSVRIEWR